MPMKEASFIWIIAFIIPTIGIINLDNDTRIIMVCSALYGMVIWYVIDKGIK